MTEALTLRQDLEELKPLLTPRDAPLAAFFEVVVLEIERLAAAKTKPPTAAAEPEAAKPQGRTGEEIRSAAAAREAAGLPPSTRRKAKSAEPPPDAPESVSASLEAEPEPRPIIMLPKPEPERKWHHCEEDGCDFKTQDITEFAAHNESHWPARSI